MELKGHIYCICGDCSIEKGAVRLFVLYCDRLNGVKMSLISINKLLMNTHYHKRSFVFRMFLQLQLGSIRRLIPII